MPAEASDPTTSSQPLCSGAMRSQPRGTGPRARKWVCRRWTQALLGRVFLSMGLEGA